MNLDLQAIQHVWYMKSVHPDPQVQAAAEACIKDYTDFAASRDLSQKFYQRVAAIDLESASAAERLMVKSACVTSARRGSIATRPPANGYAS